MVLSIHVSKFINLGSQTHLVLLTINKRQAKSQLLSKYSQAKPQQKNLNTFKPKNTKKGQLTNTIKL